MLQFCFFCCIFGSPHFSVPIYSYIMQVNDSVQSFMMGLVQLETRAYVIVFNLVEPTKKVRANHFEFFCIAFLQKHLAVPRFKNTMDVLVLYQVLIVSRCLVIWHHFSVLDASGAITFYQACPIFLQNAQLTQIHAVYKTQPWAHGIIIKPCLVVGMLSSLIPSFLIFCMCMHIYFYQKCEFHGFSTTLVC